MEDIWKTEIPRTDVVLYHLREYPEFELNRQRLFGHSYWWVHKDYVIRDNFLQPKRIHLDRLYAPAIHEELPGEIAKFREGDEEALLGFAQMYGSLGYGALSTKGFSRGDPIEWIWAHACGIRICLAITKFLQEGDNAALETYLTNLRESRPQPKVACRDTIGGLNWENSRIRGKDQARNIRRRLINEHIAGIHRMLSDVDGHDQLFFTFTALIEVAYWHLANVVAGGHRVRSCADKACRALFIQTDPRQQFCPPRGRQKESSCAIRHRVNKYRKKKSRNS